MSELLKPGIKPSEVVGPGERFDKEKKQDGAKPSYVHVSDVGEYDVEAEVDGVDYYSRSGDAYIYLYTLPFGIRNVTTPDMEAFRSSLADSVKREMYGDPPYRSREGCPHKRKRKTEFWYCVDCGVKL